jgi:mono/diheme cytochrome c family protein
MDFATPHRPKLPAFLALVVMLYPAGLMAQHSTQAQTAPSYADMSGEQLYQTACANCHGIDGAGAPQAKLGFDIEVPDFTSCTFASREPDADWVGVAHEGGPLRVFSAMMPAFGDAVESEDLQRVMDYVRTLCGEDGWPRGELNMPRPMVTEKAYPEDEAVWTSDVALDGPGAVMNEFVYERRFGARNQFEIVIPFGYRERTIDGEQDWVAGLGDVVLGVKHALFHSHASGSILSTAAEIKLPTGDETDGFGSGTSVFEAFVSYGQLLPADAFLQFQGVLELPFDTERADNEAALRFVVGRTFTQGSWGRAWSPMVEVLAGRDLESGATTHWDLVPQFQVTLNKRQHVMANVAVRIPVNDTDAREPRILVYVLWDWFDGGLFDGW